MAAGPGREREAGRETRQRVSGSEVGEEKGQGNGPRRTERLRKIFPGRANGGARRSGAKGFGEGPAVGAAGSSPGVPGRCPRALLPCPAEHKLLSASPTEPWSIRDKLCLASSVIRSGGLNWRGKKGEVVETVEDVIVRKLTAECIEELKKINKETQEKYRQLKKDAELIQAGHMDNRLEELCNEIMTKKKMEEEKMEEEEAEVKRKATDGAYQACQAIKNPPRRLPSVMVCSPAGSTSLGGDYSLGDLSKLAGDEASPEDGGTRGWRRCAIDARKMKKLYCSAKSQASGAGGQAGSS